MSIFNKLRKGPTIIQMTPVASFTSMAQVIVYWVAALGLLWYTGEQMGIPVLDLMFGWIWDGIKSVFES